MVHRKRTLCEQQKVAKFDTLTAAFKSQVFRDMMSCQLRNCD